MSYTNPLLALEALKNLPAVRGYPSDADEEFLVNLLNLSAGKDAIGTIYYRIYYVAAKFLQQPTAIHVLSEAEDGVTFTGLAVPIQSLFALQSAEDAALGLIVPPGFEALPINNYAIFSTNSIPKQIIF